jgi:hypothetical protein
VNVLRWRLHSPAVARRVRLSAEALKVPVPKLAAAHVQGTVHRRLDEHAGMAAAALVTHERHHSPHHRRGVAGDRCPVVSPSDPSSTAAPATSGTSRRPRKVLRPSASDTCAEPPTARPTAAWRASCGPSGSVGSAARPLFPRSQRGHRRLRTAADEASSSNLAAARNQARTWTLADSPDADG